MQVTAKLNSTFHLKRKLLAWVGTGMYGVGVIVSGTMAVYHIIFGGGRSGTLPGMLQGKI